MKTVHVLGSLDYHDSTILYPLFQELESQTNLKKETDIVWAKMCVSSKDVHISPFVDNVMVYWQKMINYIIKNVKDGDTILITDFWFPPITTIKYLFSQKKWDVKLFAIHHGSTHLPDDFATQFDGEWASLSEDSWIECYDKIFVGSQSVIDIMKEQDLKRFEKHNEKFVPTYLPITHIQKIVESVKKNNNIERKKNTVIFPLRLSDDKGALELFEFAAINPQLKISVASPVNVSPELLSRAVSLNIKFLGILPRVELFDKFLESEYVFSWAGQETFGYSVLEAVLMGCYPILCNKNVYPELYPSWVCWDNVLEIDLEKKDIYEPESHTLPKIGNPQKTMADIILK